MHGRQGLIGRSRIALLAGGPVAIRALPLEERLVLAVGIAREQEREPASEKCGLRLVRLLIFEGAINAAIGFAKKYGLSTEDMFAASRMAFESAVQADAHTGKIYLAYALTTFKTAVCIERVSYVDKDNALWHLLRGRLQGLARGLANARIISDLERRFGFGREYKDRHGMELLRAVTRAAEQTVEARSPEHLSA